MVEDEQPRDGAKSSEPPREPASSWLPDDQSGHDGDANGRRWLPHGAGGTTTAQPEPAPSEPQLPAPERRPSDPQPPAPEPQGAAAPESDTSAASSRRRRAVEAYCAELCLPEQASAAATETLGSFVDGDDHHLLRVMRVVAAKHVNPLPDHRRGWRRKLSAEREGECSLTPSILAARANDEMSETERAKLDDHCESCVTCQALELRSRRAERAFAAIMRMPVAAGAVAGREATVVTPEAAIAPGAEAAIAPGPRRGRGAGRA